MDSVTILRENRNRGLIGLERTYHVGYNPGSDAEAGELHDDEKHERPGDEVVAPGERRPYSQQNEEVGHGDREPARVGLGPKVNEVNLERRGDNFDLLPGKSKFCS